MATETTPHMGLVLPLPNSEPGPAWASEQTTALQVVDAHDHTFGNGVPIPSGAIAWDDVTSLEGCALESVEYVQLNTVILPTPPPLLLYVDAGGELHYVNNSGVDLKLTSGGALNLTSTRGINGDYATDAANPSVFFTTASATYTFTTDGADMALVKVGGLLVSVSLLAGNVTIADTDGVGVLSVDTTAARTVTLPLAAHNRGRALTIKDGTGTANTHNISVAVQGTDHIDGGTTATVTANWGVLRLVSNGTRWLVV